MKTQDEKILAKVKNFVEWGYDNGYNKKTIDAVAHSRFKKYGVTHKTIKAYIDTPSRLSEDKREMTLKYLRKHYPTKKSSYIKDRNKALLMAEQGNTEDNEFWESYKMDKEEDYL